MNRFACGVAAALLTLLAGFHGTAGTLVQFRTVFGDVEVELLDQEKPITVSNFLAYVNSGAYKDSFFHRAVPNFVLQGGGYAVSNRFSTNAIYFSIPTGAPITNEFHAGPFESNVAGTIAMAKTSDPNSATSEFFFNLADNRVSLDDTNNSGGFTVFGKVVGGTNSFSLYNSFTYTIASPYTNLVVNIGTPFTELPVRSLTQTATGLTVTFADLVFVDITTLRVRVVPLGNGRQIFWNAATQATNIVEYTSQFPPVWHSLTNVARPAAGTNSVVDPSGDRNRFYRVRTAY